MRALGLSLALHAAAAAAYGGYQLGADVPPSFEVGGAYIALSIRGAPGGGPAGAPAPAAPGEPDPALLEPASLVAQVVVAPPPVDATAAAGVVAANAVASALDAAAPAVEALSEGLTRRVAALVEVSIQNARHAARPPDALASWSASSTVASGARGASAGTGVDATATGDERGEGGSGADSGRGDGGGLSGPGAGSGNLPPIYPEEERLAGHEGTVIVRAVCAASGAVESVSVERSSGYPRLDEAALEAVRDWTFVPQLENGVAVASEVVFPVIFSISHLSR